MVATGIAFMQGSSITVPCALTPDITQHQSMIWVCPFDPDGVTPQGRFYVSAILPGHSFTISSTAEENIEVMWSVIRNQSASQTFTP